ncbi:PASTA domain-containing protein [Streptomyces griseosporeus]|uniref:PASTA domain-containing protein n=1 Tax=Streptomyces griseosporeus TaxID=1910 RepID=UPI003799FA3D
MRTRTRNTTAATALAAAALLALTSCGPDDKGGAAGTDGKPSTADTATLPDMTGKGLQSAQDQAQAAGFRHLASHDALGRGRHQVLDRNWKVCAQTPKAGEHPTDTEVDFATVKLEEDCPSTDQGDVQEAGTTMPDFKGKSVKVARQALDSSTSITVTDASGEDRMILVESNWQVCSQDPAPGAKLDGQPVAFTAVKFGESC